MRATLCLIAGLAGGLAGGLAAAPARADDAASCRDGIAMIKAELAKSPAEPLQRSLRKALRTAERELGEGEFDECMDAVRDAGKALGR
ncbi:conserved hypothetical protein [Methylobacterium sp. 4-46]|uniref:hypothetical protein n=1 Tax=unclassified Methylobacterium TaxID=2615210 RepID=UPI000152E446|nr:MULTISPECIES: hypothetical protein [Methylobacterium]ACA19337.1 conserved hypothetical protein [Methylobacterium sp. 4-46]WFT78536.1 hypothetical protein QA634_25185 [Methylobacterium nodulans]